MRNHYVKVSNHKEFASHYAAIEARGSKERCILLLTGVPGSGKTRLVDNFGSEKDAIYLEGIPGMTLSFLRDHLCNETGVSSSRRFEEYKMLREYLEGKRIPIILDEAQHGLPHKAECIEYLRRLAELAGVPLILVCHESEQKGFGRHKHIADRVGSVCTLRKATAEDVALYCRELCEVDLADEVIATVLSQSRGLYRLMGDAVTTLERIARKLGKTRLEVADIAKVSLCEDLAARLRGVA